MKKYRDILDCRSQILDCYQTYHPHIWSLIRKKKQFCVIFQQRYAVGFPMFSSFKNGCFVFLLDYPFGSLFSTQLDCQHVYMVAVFALFVSHTLSFRLCIERHSIVRKAKRRENKNNVKWYSKLGIELM